MAGAGARELGQEARDRAPARGAGAVHAHQPGRGHQPGQRRLHPLRAHPLTRDVGPVTAGTDPRHRLLVAAVVAGQAARRLVLDQGHVAVGAARDPAAAAAERHEGEPPPAGQHDRLLAAQGGLVERRRQRPRHRPGALRAHVHDLDGRQRRAVGALGQAEAREGVPGLGARRGAAVDDRRPGRPGAAGRHLAGVVARRGVLLVRAVVLLVDHDQAEVLHGREDRAARAQHHVRAALAHAPVLGRPLGRRQGRVPDRDVLAEAGAQAPEQLRGERDLGDQHDAPAAARPGRLDGVQVHLGLPRAGHPVHQQGPALPVHPPLELGHDRGLGAGERRRGVRARRRAARRGEGVARTGALPDQRDRAGVGHRPQGRHGGARVGAQPRRGQAPAGPLEDRGHLAPARGEPLERRAGALGDQALRAAPRRGGQHPAAVVGAPQRPAAPRRQHQPQAGRDRGQVVPGHPPRQLEELGRHRGDVDDAGQGHQAPGVGRGGAVHDHAEHPPRPEGAHDQGARLRGPVEPPGDRVVQDAVEPARRHQGEDLGGGAHLTAVRPWRRAFRRPRGRRRCSPT